MEKVHKGTPPFARPSAAQRMPPELANKWDEATALMTRPDRQAMHCLANLESPLQLRLRMQGLLARLPPDPPPLDVEAAAQAAARAAAAVAGGPVVASPIFFDGDARHRGAHKRAATQRLQAQPPAAG